VDVTFISGIPVSKRMKKDCKIRKSLTKARKRKNRNEIKRMEK